MEVEVLVHEAAGVRRIVLDLTLPATAGEVLAAAGLTEHGLCSFGVRGQLGAADSLVRDGDRVEVYRPLVADPKQVRRQRAKVRRPAGRPSLT